MHDQTLPNPIRAFVTDFVTRRRRIAMLRAAGISVAAFIGWMLLVCLLDRLLALQPSWRLVAILFAVAFVIMPIIRPLACALRRSFDWISVAAEIERHRPAFGERLITVISQWHAAEDRRGSPEMLERLSESVTAETSLLRGSRLVPNAAAVRPWLLAATLLLVIIGLSAVPSFGWPRLMHRFFEPLAMLPPVTTTQLSVTPGGIDTLEGRPLTILAKPDRLNGDSVRIYLSDDGRTWAASPMTEHDPGIFAYTIASVDRDVSYYVAGGDARTPKYTVRVMRPPAIVEFRIQYSYPRYTGMNPRTVSNTDGRIEAPVGTDVVVDARANQPIRNAAMRTGSKVQPVWLAPTGESSVVRTKFIVQRDEPFILRMTGATGFVGSGPSTCAIRALPDQPPLVQLLEPRDEVVRCGPRDQLPIRYAADDDYGLQSLSIHVQNRSPVAANVALPVTGDIRRQRGTFTVDLAAIASPEVGDVISIWLEARDRGGQTGSSEPRHVLIVPDTVDFAARQRATELAAAAQRALALTRELAAAREKPATPAIRIRHLARAGEIAAALKQSLLRAIVLARNDALASTLANLVDDAEICAAVADQIVEGPLASNDAAASPTNAELAEATAPETHLCDWLRTLVRAERAARLLAESDELAVLVRVESTVLSSLSGPDVAARQLQRATARQQAVAQMHQELESLDLKPDAPDLHAQLDLLVAAGKTLVDSQRPIDFAVESRPWAEELGRPRDWPSMLDRRLSAAAMAETVRQDADFVRARDLQLASLAARRLSARRSLPAATQPGDDPRTAFPAAMQAMARDELTSRQVLVTRGAKPDDPVVASAATRARDQMRRWAGDEDVVVGDEPADTTTALDLAMNANVAMARRQYDAARRLDGELLPAATQPSPDRLKTSSSVDAGLANALQAGNGGAQTLDALITEQARLRAALNADAVDGASSTKDGQGSLSQRIDQALRSADIVSESRDSLRAAQSESDATVAALSRTPADLPAAREAQTRGISALADARSGVLHRAAMTRLAATGSMAWLFVPAAAEHVGRGVASPTVPAWQPRSVMPAFGSNVGASQPNPAGYENALKVYFEALAGNKDSKR